MRRIRVAQIGVNRYSHGLDIFKTMKSMPELFDIVGYAIVEDEREHCQNAIASLEGYREMTVEEILSDPTIEAVTVETDEIHLLKYARMVAEAGKHMHMEKPGSQSIADFEALINIVKANKTVFHTGYMYRYNPLVSELIERKKAGELGEIHSVEAHMSRFDKKAVREWFGSFKGGMMFYLGCHLIDLVLQIQGMPTEVIPLNTRTGLDGVDTEDLGFAVLRYPTGISVIRMGGTEMGGSRRRQLVICGSERTLEIKPLEASIRDAAPYMQYTEQTDLASDENGHSLVTQLRSEPFQRYEAMLFAFAEMVRGERENPYTLEYELQLFKLILRCCGMEV